MRSENKLKDKDIEINTNKFLFCYKNKMKKINIRDVSRNLEFSVNLDEKQNAEKFVSFVGMFLKDQKAISWQS